MIPLVDLQAQYEQIGTELVEAVKATLKSGAFILGPNVTALEAEVASYCETDFAIGVASGTDALHLALLALGIGPGDEVITTPFTFIATAEAISYVGATPVFADIDPLTFNIDATAVGRKISSRTKAIIPVHLYGQPADMDSLMAVANEHGLAVVEDCAQAIGARFEEKRVGSFGALGCLSFFPSKNLGGAGDGGMIITSDEGLAARIKRLRAHGSNRKYYHAEIGFNSRLDELQAAILRVKLRYLDQWTSGRQAAAERYSQLLSGSEKIILPARAARRTHVWHQFTVRVRERDRVRQRLSDNRIDSAIHYPLPIHRQEAYAHLNIERSDYPVSDQAAREVLSLPMHPHLTQEQVSQVCAVLQGHAARPKLGTR